MEEASTNRREVKITVWLQATEGRISRKRLGKIDKRREFTIK
jgi:hypothetical protein